MGLQQTHALGRTQRGYAVTEGTPGTQEKPAGTDAVRALSLGRDPQQERKDRDDWRQTRSRLERITGKASIAWDMESYLMPSGAAGTPPDIHPFLKAAMGAYTNTPSTSDVYTLSDSQTLDTLSVTREGESILADALCVAAVLAVAARLVCSLVNCV